MQDSMRACVKSCKNGIILHLFTKEIDMRVMKRLCALLMLVSVAFGAEEVLRPKVADNVRFIAYDKGFHKLLDTTQRALLLYDKGVWLEGVQVLPNGDVVASDVKQNMLLTFHGLDGAQDSKQDVENKGESGRTKNSKQVSKHAQKDSQSMQGVGADFSFRLVMLKPSHFQNGHALDLQGRLIAASHGRRGIERLENGTWQLLTDSYNGGKLNSPNDVVVDSRGEVWFSDPRFGLKNPLEGYGGEDMQGGDYLYRLSVLESSSAKHTPNTAESKRDFQSLESHAQGANKRADSKEASKFPAQSKSGIESAQIVRLHAKGLQAPNGLAFSPDEKLLYVADSARAYNFDDKSLPAQILVYKVNADRSLGAGRVFARIDSGIPDGIKVDHHGNVWSSSVRGIVVFAPSGKKLGEIVFPELVGNLAFSLSQAQKLALQKQGVDVAYPNQKGKRLYVTSGSKLYMLEVNVESGIRR